MDFSKPVPANDKTLAGAATCRQCHAKISDSYLKNPHQQTSRAMESNSLDIFPAPHSSEFVFDKHLKLVVEKRKTGVFQVAYFNGKETVARRFDITIGSGENGYTFGSWEGNKLKQLPLSYFKIINSWANSPGYPSDKAYFDRLINTRCLECHSSFVDRNLVSNGSMELTEELDRKSLIYGIDCERCHGPAGKHVEFHLENPENKTAKYIAIYKTLTSQQKIDGCAICHSGKNIQLEKSIFSFKPGDNIRDYYLIAPGTSSQPEADVHGNQSALLASSKCFIKSKTMDCSSCHNTHENIKGNLKVYSQRCMNCHTSIKHSKVTLANALVKTNCIDCHMPLQASKLITFQLAGSKDASSFFLRSHHIGIN